MILADKIVALRKKAGWSQEELAEQLGVTRQSVSKWEGAQSVPEIDKIIQMSRLFEVTTDYLLKDELEEQEYAAEGLMSADAAPARPMRRVTMEEASRYLELRKEAASKIAVGVFLCIVSPICLIALDGFEGYSILGIPWYIAEGLGLCVLILLIAAGVALFCSCGFKSKEFEYLEKEIFETEYGVSGMVKDRKEKFQGTYSSLNIKGTVLCIVSVIPMFLAGDRGIEPLEEIGVCVMLFLIGLGCIALIYGGVIEASMEKLLQEGDYTRENKESKHILAPVSGIYWLVVTAIFLWYTMGPYGNLQFKSSRFIWMIAGVIYGAVVVVVKMVERTINK